MEGRGREWMERVETSSPHPKKYSDAAPNLAFFFLSHFFGLCATVYSSTMTWVEGMPSPNNSCEMSTRICHFETSYVRRSVQYMEQFLFSIPLYYAYSQFRQETRQEMEYLVRPMWIDFLITIRKCQLLSPHPPTHPKKSSKTESIQH